MHPNGRDGCQWRAIRRQQAAASREDKVAERPPIDRTAGDHSPVGLLERHADVAGGYLKIRLAQEEERSLSPPGHLNPCRSTRAFTQCGDLSKASRGRRRNGYRIGKQSRARRRALETIRKGLTLRFLGLRGRDQGNSIDDHRPRSRTARGEGRALCLRRFGHEQHKSGQEKATQDGYDAHVVPAGGVAPETRYVST